jgi:capsular polysaccharide transport system permease protein
LYRNTIHSVSEQPLRRELEALYYRGCRDEALARARRAFAVARDRDTADLCAWLFSNCGCHDEAVSAYRRLIAFDPGWAEGYRHLSGALFAAGRAEEAAAAACRAVELAPCDAGAAIHAAELLLRAGRSDEAAGLLRRSVEAMSSAPAWRVLSGIEMLRGDPGAALAAIDRALALAPDTAEYHLHRGHALYRLGAADAAAAAFGEAGRLDQATSEAKRAQLAAFVAGGRLGEATVLGGDLLRRFPDDDGAAAAVLELLARRLNPDGGEPPVTPMRKDAAPLRVSRLGDALRCQGRVLHALMLREARTRFGEARLGYGWAVLEPLLHIALLFVMFALVMRGRPPLGSQFFMFYYTGLLPYHVFTHAAGAMTHGITGNGAVLNLPKVTACDVVLARFLVEFVTDIVVAALLFGAFAACGLAHWPDDPSGPCLAVLAAAALGCGVGFLNAVLQALFRAWDKIWVQAMRLLYFASGIFYLPGMMPDWARDILAWNPLLQAIDWFRAGYFAAYRPPRLDPAYLAAVAVLAVAAGLAAERGLRRRLWQPA